MRAIYLMARREYLSYVATWGFWLSLLSVPMFMLVGGMLPVLIQQSEPTRHYVVIDHTGHELAQAIVSEVSAAGLGDRFVLVDPPGDTIDDLRPYLLGEQSLEPDDESQALFAAVFLEPDDAAGIRIDYWSTNLTTMSLANQVEDAVQAHLRNARLGELGISPQVLAAVNAIDPRANALNPERSGEAAAVSEADRVPFYVGVAMAFGLWVIVFSVTNMLLTAMIEEKGNKILETLLATARYHEILIGKLAGLAAVSATLLLAWGSMGSGGMLAIQALNQSADLPVSDILNALFDPGLLLPALGYFVIGYLMFGTMYLAIGSLCDTLQEAQSLMSPIFLIMFIPLFIVMSTVESPDSGFVQAASWFPFWTPFLMMARLQTDPSMFELVGTTIVMLVTAVAVISLASYVFRQGSLGRANASSVKKLFSRKKASA
jgi:ABC-2 type transport system permease protein